MKKFLIVGLGNPGAEYENTRHNIGFLTLDALAKASNVKKPILCRVFSYSAPGLPKPTMRNFFIPF